jgi:hypothetical protein
MSCELDINDIIGELGKSSLSSVSGLPSDQVAGVLAAIANTVGQDSTEINNGLGTYGLTADDLELTGIIKCGFSLDDELATALADSSLFTGKNGVNNVTDLTGSPPEDCETAAARINRERAAALQQKIMNEAIAAKMKELGLQGGLTGDETDQELASLSGKVSKFSIDTVLAGVDTAMNALGVLAAVGALIVVVKNADIAGKLSGFGSAATSEPEQETDTIDESDTNENVDAIVGSSRVPSAAANPDGSAPSNLQSAANEFRGKYI